MAIYASDRFTLDHKTLAALQGHEREQIALREHERKKLEGEHEVPGKSVPVRVIEQFRQLFARCISGINPDDPTQSKD